MYTYPWYHWITFFYIYCFLGWIVESTYVSLQKRRLVNRGFLRLPMIPLYGTGAVMMLWVSLPVKDNLILVYIAGFFAASALEYVTGWIMERLFKMRYWDYSSQRFNFHGYICLSSSVAWGFLTIFMTDLIHRPIEKLVCGIPVILDLLLILPVTAVFLQDAFASIREALDFGHSLERANQIRQELDGLRVQTALLKMDAGDRIEEKRAELESWLKEREEALLAIRDRRKQFLQSALRANPTMVSHKYAEELKEMMKGLSENGKGRSSQRGRRKEQ